MARPHVPKFGNWESENNALYTVCFEKAREGRNTGGNMAVLPNNSPQRNPDGLSKFAPPSQPKRPPPKLVAQPDEPIIRGPVRPTTHHERKSSKDSGRGRSPTHHEHKTSKENGPAHERKTSRDSGRGRSPTHYHERKTSKENGPTHHEKTSKESGRVHGFGRPVRRSAGSESELSGERSPVRRVGGWSPSSEGKSSYGSRQSTPDRARARPVNRGRQTPDRAAAVPKFGAWANDPSAAVGYTVVFNKVREEKHSGDSAKSPNRLYEPSYNPRQKYHDDDYETTTCCFPWGKK